MKHRITALILSLSLPALLFGACKAKPGEASLPSEEQTSAQTVSAAAESETQTPDYDAIYDEVLDNFCKLIDTDNTEFEGVQGVREAIHSGKNVGFVIKDISGDGIPELMIGANVDADEAGKQVTEIYAVYTCVNGKPFFAFEGSARSCYKPTENGELFYSGANGAMDSSFGIFVPEPDGASLICREFWFSTAKKDDETKQVFFSNSTGSFDTDCSEEQKITAEEFERKKLEAEKDTICFDLTELKWVLPADPNAYDGRTPARVTAGFAPTDGELTEHFREYAADTSEYAVKVIFRTDKKVTAFKLLKLTFESVDGSGKISYSQSEEYKLDVFTPSEPFIAAVAFPGDIPAYGISYIDADGTLRCFTLNISGEDGSLLLTEF